MVGDFIGRQPGFAQTRLGKFVERTGAVVVGNGKVAAGMGGMKGGALLDGELVERQVVACERQRLFQLRVPLRRLLPGPCIDEIEGKAREMPAREIDRRE